MFAFFARMLARNSAPRGGGNVAAEIESPVKATMAGIVRRFQGVFECGCAAHPLDEPHECPVHGASRLYTEEVQPVEFGDVRVVA